ncbi:MAG: hypothetical protein NTW10_11065 [Bacteroidetes bacterium]|nr:hypothetical protein [Bacteroidota bacterium]
MKALRLFITGFVLLFAGTMQGQVSVNVSIGSPPLWGPAGYAEVQYYYLPDVEAYYDVHTAMFIYSSGGAWIHRAYLPSQYRNYDLYGGYKVVMNGYHGNAPYSNFKEYKRKYGKGYHGGAQKTVGERPGKGNPGNNQPHQGNQGDHNSGHGNDKGNSQGHDKNGKEDHGNGGGKGKK